MDKLQWAIWGATYLHDLRVAKNDTFGLAMEENRGPRTGPYGDWHTKPKNVISSFYHMSQEFFADANVPGANFSSPSDFEKKINSFDMFMVGMQADLDVAVKNYQSLFDRQDTPEHISIIQGLLVDMRDAISFVDGRNPSADGILAANDPIELIKGVCQHFHESVLALSKHPHGGKVLLIKNEWDCIYLLRSILSAYIGDIRMEEWSPSFAGTSTRCEFFLKDHKTMIELRYARKAGDTKKFLKELAVDLLSYSQNTSVERLIILVYDPLSVLEDAVQLARDFTKRFDGFSDVSLLIAPPRGAVE